VGRSGQCGLRVVLVAAPCLFVALVAGLSTACGEEAQDPTGVYVYKSADSALSACELRLSADNTWAIQEPGGNGGWTGHVAWKLTWTEAHIKFKGEGDWLSTKAYYDGQEIAFDDVTWVRVQ